MSGTDEISDLLALVALGNRQAFDTLYKQTSAKLFGVTLRLLKNRAEAEDALQDVYVKVWQKSGQFAASQARPMSWLIAIARNTAIDRLRARRTALDGLDAAEEVPDSGPSPEMAAVQADERARIEHCLGLLEQDKALAVRSAYLEGYSYQELANHFGTPLNTMRTWLRRSLIKLRACLEE